MLQQKDLLDIYQLMQKIRKFEEKVIDLYGKGYIGSSVHLYIGEEAIAATIGKMLRKEDYISSTHRGHGHIIGKGARMDMALAEILGKATGYCKGKGGSMHIADFENGVIGANGIVGGGMAAAVGAGLSAKMRKTDNISVVYFGDGASNEGIFHESINLAAVWDLPVIFVCENNGFGISVTLKESTSVEDISLRAAGYGIPGHTVDGNDVFDIYNAMSKAIERARSGKGPSLVECKTYRWRGHWEGDLQVSRKKEDLEIWMEKDPIKRLENYFLSKLNIKLEEIDKIIANVENEIEKAVDFAISSPDPDPNDLLENLFT